MWIKSALFSLSPYAFFTKKLYPLFFASKTLMKGNLGDFSRLNIPTPYFGNILKSLYILRLSSSLLIDTQAEQAGLSESHALLETQEK